MLTGMEHYEEPDFQYFMNEHQHNFGVLSTSSVGKNIDTIVDSLVDNNPTLLSGNWLYFMFTISGNLTTPNMGANSSWWYGMMNNTKTYGWIRGESFDVSTRGTRKNASTFTFT